MRIRRPVPGTGAVPGQEAAQSSVTGLKVLPVPPERASASLESMFEEISSNDLAEGQAARTPLPATRYDDLWQLSFSDPLTGLANRMLLLDRLTRELTRSRRHGGCVIVSHIDLGNLKDINDQFGYTSGNEVLRGMARRLTSMLRSEDTVSRVGESELVAVMTVDDERFAGPLMQRVRGVLGEPISVTGGRVQVTAVLGTVTARASESAEEVLARAVAAA